MWWASAVKKGEIYASARIDTLNNKSIKVVQNSLKIRKVVNCLLSPAPLTVEQFILVQHYAVYNDNEKIYHLKFENIFWAGLADYISSS